MQRTGNAGPWEGSLRPGLSLFTSSILALDYRTGQYKWHFQQVHHEIWDYDQPNPPAIYDTVINGQPRKGLYQASKTGWLYFLDRTNGQPLIGIDEKPVPQEPRQNTWPTQPYPQGDAFVRQCPEADPNFGLSGCIFTAQWPCMPDAARLARLANQVAVVGLGESDYPLDYRRVRAGERYSDSYGYAATAFKRALADAGLSRQDIDGLIVGPTLSYERMAEVVGLEPRWAAKGDAIGAIFEGVLAITSGLAECVALVYGNDQRSAGTAYGGPEAMGGAEYLSYVYYAPWGMTSQGALYALMTQRYMQVTGFGSEDLGRVAVAQRQFASLNPAAIMQKRITLDEYLAAPYIVEPLRLLDYCLINDGGVALILTTAERAQRVQQPLVTIGALARADENIDATSMRPRLMHFYHGGHELARTDLYAMAGFGPEDVDCLQVYDSFSCHVVYALEGFGFCPMGDVGGFLRDRGIGPGGTLPTNTSGGHLSHSYMQGWNHQVEAVRQARGEAGERQVPGARHVQYISDVAGKTLSVIYRKASA